MRAPLVVACLVFVLFPQPAAAQWSVTGLLGDARTSPAGLTVLTTPDDTHLQIGAVEFADESSHSPWYYGARVTRDLERVPWLAIEAEFIHAKAISDPSQMVRVTGRMNGIPVAGTEALGKTLPRFELSHGLNVLVGNAVLHWPIVRVKGHPFLELAGRGGAGLSIPHVEATFAGESTDRYQLGGLALAGSFGAEVRIARHVSGVLEVAWTRTSLGLDIGSADLEANVTTRHIIGGVMWRFSPTRSQP
jgi:hypothetical protein